MPVRWRCSGTAGEWVPGTRGTRPPRGPPASAGGRSVNKAAVTGHMETAGLLPLRGRKARPMWLDSGKEPQFRLSGWSPWPKPRHPVPAGSEPGSPAAAPSAFLSHSWRWPARPRAPVSLWPFWLWLQPSHRLSRVPVVGALPSPPPSAWRRLASGRGGTVPCGPQPLPSSFRNAACSTASGFASLVSRRTSPPSLGKSGKTCRKGRFQQRGPAPSPVLGPECRWLPGPQRRLHGLWVTWPLWPCLDGLSRDSVCSWRELESGPQQ